MLESYDDTGGCGAFIICLVGLIVFTICMWNAYPPDKRHTECKCKCKCTIECEHKGGNKCQEHVLYVGHGSQRS